MNFPFYIARRYLFSKKRQNVINVISAVSVVGVAVATMALVVTLSVFNGFHDLVATLFTSFDPQIEVAPVEGKTVAADDPVLTELRGMAEVDVATDCIEDLALVVYGGRQAMVTIKGVDDNFDRLTHIREILLSDDTGEFQLHVADLEYGILGIRLAERLGTGIRFTEPFYVYAPRRDGQLDLTAPEESFTVDELYSPGVIFQVMQAKYDANYIVTSIGFARRLFDQQGMVSKLELRLKPGSDFDAVKRRMQQVAGTQFTVKDRYEQQDDTFRIMKVEKFIAYIFLTFILIVASFNIIGSLSMLIIDKRDDVGTLRSLGASDRQVATIFLFEGWLISIVGAIVGIAFGLLLCWLQQQFGIIKLGSEQGAFIVDSYPVSVHPTDILLVFITVVAVGFVASWWPVRYFVSRKNRK